VWKVRPAQVTDIFAIEGLLVSADGDLENLAEDQFVVAEDEDGAILGCGRLRPYPDFCELASLAVDQEVRARGVGRVIVSSLLERYQGPIYLICEDNVVDFFRRFRFECIPETDMPAGLRPKWEYFAALTGHMNVMRRE
jgi:N-acetylglutamate synthase-like GNAT family acetyltransferase